MITSKQILQEGLNLLSDESKWCKGASARDKKDFPVFVGAPSACKWCLEGALSKIVLDLMKAEKKPKKELVQFSTDEDYLRPIYAMFSEIIARNKAMRNNGVCSQFYFDIIQSKRPDFYILMSLLNRYNDVMGYSGVIELLNIALNSL